MISYPYKIEGQLDCYENPLQIHSPSQLAVRLESSLGAESDVADIGAFSGDTGLFLAQKGHRVASVDIDHEVLRDGIHKSLALGSAALRSYFIEGDARSLMFRDEQFDAVISTMMLQHISKGSVPKALSEIRRITRPGGLNAVRVYSGTAEEIKMKPGYSIFEFGELELVYGSLGWRTIYYDEMQTPLTTDSAGKTWVSSHSEIIAQNPV